jgi:hypothetical protein
MSFTWVEHETNGQRLEIKIKNMGWGLLQAGLPRSGGAGPALLAFWG